MNKNKIYKIDLIIPIHNNDKNLAIFIRNARHYRVLLKKKKINLRVIFVNDGSTDDSLKILIKQSNKHKYLKIINLSKSFGFQKAVLSALDYVSGDYIAVSRLIDMDWAKFFVNIFVKFDQGNDVVYGLPVASINRGLIRGFLSKSFYKVLKKFSGVDLSHEFESVVVIRFTMLETVKNIWTKGLYVFNSLHWVGFRTGKVYFNYNSGEISRPLEFGEKIKLFSEVIFSFSDLPLKWTVSFGLFVCFFAGIIGLIILYLRLFTPYTVPGISAVILSVLFMGGVQVLILGIIARYIGIVFKDSNQIPNYVVTGLKNIKTENEDLSALGELVVFEKEEYFHDEWADSIKIDEVMVDEFFEACTAPENQIILKSLGKVKGKKILEIGCGLGEASVYLAKKGAKVVASDISGEMIKLANDVAKYHKVKIDICKCSSIKIPFADGSFDVVYAGNVLHHVDIEETLAEVSRVLKKGGLLVSWDPLAHNPLINIYRQRAQSVRTEDEHPIKWGQIKLFEKYFSKVKVETTWFFTLWIFIKYYLFDRVDPSKERYWKKILTDGENLKPTYKPLERLDKTFLKVFPFMKRYCWNIVVVAKK